ncbi:MAG: hypothetical protein ACI8Q3_001514, partial [Marinomonas primoryensis]
AQGKPVESLVMLEYREALFWSVVFDLEVV